MENESKLFPVVIVGKDRTRMTMAVADAIRKHIVNGNPYFIVVSDRSRPGHVEAVGRHLESEIGEIGWEVLETSTERYGWGAAIDIGLERAWEIGAECAMVVDNDWILQRDVDIAVAEGILGKTAIGCLSYKCISAGTNIETREQGIDDDACLVHVERFNDRPSYVVEIGCMTISRRFHSEIGNFLENVNNTDEVEHDFIRRYVSIPGDARRNRRILFATQKCFLYDALNGENHVFTHVGMESQSGRVQTWGIPREYVDLNDERKDEECRKDALNHSSGGNRILYATNGDFRDGCILNKTRDRLCEIAGGEVYVVPSDRFGKEAFLDIFRKAIEGDYDYVIYSDADNLIVSSANLFRLFEDFKSHGDCIFGGCPDGGMFCHRNHNPNAINPFLLFVRVSLLKKYYDSESGRFRFHKRRKELADGAKSVISDYSSWRSSSGYRNKFAEKISGRIDDEAERRFFGEWQHPWEYNVDELDSEPYYDIFLGIDEADRIYYFNGGDYVWDDTGISSSVRWFGGGEHDHSRDGSIVSVHTWFARFCMSTPKNEFEKVQLDRIRGVLGHWCDDIDWKSHFDRIYCIHYDGFSDREAELSGQLSRVGILGSGIFQYVHTRIGEEEKRIFEENRGTELMSIGYASEIVGFKRILEDSLAKGYSRIMVLEDDVRFLKSVMDIKNILRRIPTGYDVIQMSHIPGADVDSDRIRSNSINGAFYDATGLNETDASCIVVNRSGMERLMEYLGKRASGLDQCLSLSGCRIARSTRPLAIQRIYGNSTNRGIDANCEGYIDAMYGKIGLRRSDYQMECRMMPGSTKIDRIYCLSHVGQENRDWRLREYFAKSSAFGDADVEFVVTYPSPFDEIVFDRIRDSRFCPKPSYVNFCGGVTRILEDAIRRGCGGILYCENDVAFLRSDTEIREILSSIPEDADIVQFDNFVTEANAEGYRRLCGDSVGNFMRLRPGDVFTSSCCVYMNRKGMDEILRLMKTGKCALDQLFGMTECVTYLSRKHLGVQLVYSDSTSMEDKSVETMHGLYGIQGIDYADYCVPAGYGYGSFIDGCEVKGRVGNMIGESSSHKIGSMTNGRRRVSVYAIAYNESQFVERWMSSMSEADEVVVLDTGSTDDTVEKLRKLGARVTVEKFDKWNSVGEYDAIVRGGGNPWRFDKARNDSMALVAEDADILVTTDLDEFIQPGWRKRLENQWIAAEERGENPIHAAYKYVWHYNPDGTEARSFEVHKIHARGVCTWTHMIHEVLSYPTPGGIVHLKDFIVEHHPDHTKSRKSYLPMLEVAARDNPTNDRDCHYYGRELMYEGRWDEAIAELKRHLSLPASVWRAERAASMRYIAACYQAKGDEDMRELWLWKAVREDPRHRDASYALARIFMARKDYKSAELAWEICLGIKEKSEEYISDNACWSAEPWMLYSQCMWWNGNWGGAEEIVRLAHEMDPKNAEIAAQLKGMGETRKKYNR